MIFWRKRKKLNAGLNNLDNRVKFKLIGVENYKPNFKFDIIVSNPPQMPTRKPKSPHDDGGLDGKKHINYIIDFSSKYLKNGDLVFLQALIF